MRRDSQILSKMIFLAMETELTLLLKEEDMSPKWSVHSTTENHSIIESLFHPVLSIHTYCLMVYKMYQTIAQVVCVEMFKHNLLCQQKNVSTLSTYHL